MVKQRLKVLWHGIVDDDGKLRITPIDRSRKIRVGVIGGGLAGLTAAAYLSEHPNIEGILFERSPQLGEGHLLMKKKASPLITALMPSTGSTVTRSARSAGSWGSPSAASRWISGRSSMRKTDE